MELIKARTGAVTFHMKSQSVSVGVQRTRKNAYRDFSLKN
jgi:hypothetical protein